MTALVVETDPALLASRGRSGLEASPVALAGVVRPRTTAEVSQMLAQASAQGLRVHAVSRGNNWGYGAAAPPRPGCLLMDLSGMDRIVSIDPALAVVEVEPGVTQGQLHAALAGTGILMDATGAGPHTSLVGNVLERGFGHTPSGHRMARFVATEFVLADGTIVHPGQGAATDALARQGRGAGLHELLTQSNWAVVTRMSLWLVPRPECMSTVVLKLRHDDELETWATAVRTLVFEGVFSGVPHLGNDMRALGMVTRFDYDRFDPKAGLSDEERRELTRHHGIAPWTMTAGVYGSRAVVRAKTERAKELLAPLGRVLVVSSDAARRLQSLAAGLERWVGPRPWLTKLARQAELLGLTEGRPTELPMQGCYWRHRTLSHRPGADPVQDGCGMRWLSPTVPLDGVVVAALVRICAARIRSAGFEFACTLNAPSPRLCQAIVSIAYDSTDEAESVRARATANSLEQELYAFGWQTYRSPIDQMPAVAARTAEPLGELLDRIRGAADPDGILSPGRYCR